MSSLSADPNRLALPTSKDSISRTDSFKSERSDKRVSFNKDVGVKHIPRGLKPPAPQPPSKSRKDEWSTCAPVHLEPPPSSSKELERQAEDLVRLLDQVDCVSGNKASKSKAPPFSSQSLERTTRNNTSSLPRNKNRTLNIPRRNNLSRDRSSSPAPQSLKKVTNPPPKNLIHQNIKDNVNLYRQKRDNKSRAFKRSLSAHPSNDTTNSDTDYAYDNHRSRYQSVPDIPSKLDHRINKNYHYQSARDLSETDPSADNIYRDKLPHKPRRKTRNEYKSADNLADSNIPGNKKVLDYKSAENLHSGYSSSDFEMSCSSYQPKVGNIVKHLNYDNDAPKTHVLRHEEPSSPRGVMEPNPYTQHNENKPFSYTGASLSSIEEVRRLSPSRDIPIRREDEYSQVNKNHRQISRSTSRENERNFRNGDSDYSAKIIITGETPRRRYDDDDTYETFQVGESALARQMRELGISSDRMDDYKGLSNNNINMSSIGVQTETVPKAPYRSRRQQQSSEREEYDSRRNSEKDLSSSFLVRRATHGYGGRMERSPSPPRVVGSRSKPIRNVVPLLSDTDESEMNYRRKVDPMAKIRDQVRIRDQLYEQKREEDRDDRLFSPRHKSIHDLRSSGMQPLTIDEVDGLELEVDKRGRNSLVVAREGHSRSTSQLDQERNWARSQDRTGKLHSPPRIERRSLSPRESPPLQKHEKEDKSPSRFLSTLERIKKGASDKGKSTLERKDSKAKDKKKKRIKIKFFYDPRTQDTENDDPLKKFTEYKGTSSDERSSPRYYKGDSDGYYHDQEANRRYNTYSREGTVDRRTHQTNYSSPSRPPRLTSRDRRTSERDTSRTSRSGRDSSNERTLTRELRRSREDITGRGTHDRNRSTLERSKEYSRYSNDYVDRQDQLNNSERRNEIMDSYAATRGDFKPMNIARTHREGSHDSDLARTYKHSNVTEKNISLSDKYRSLARKESPPREIVLEETHRTHISPPIRVPDDEKKSKILRQRNKFLGVLRGEGRTKKQAPPPPPSATLPRNNHETKPSSSSTLTRTRVKEVPKEEAAAKIIEKVKEQNKSKPKKKRGGWPWSFLGLRTTRKPSTSTRIVHRPRASSRASRASSRASSARSSMRFKARKPTLRSIRARKDSNEGRSYVGRDKLADDREKRQWETATLTKRGLKSHSRDSSILKDSNRVHRQSVDSSGSSPGTPVNSGNRKANFKQRYFGDTDNESKRGRVVTGAGDYRSLPNRKARSGQSRFVMGARRNYAARGGSPGARGSAGSSLQSSESEADSHGGSHASRASRASHISTGSNRSVYLHATAVADIPVRRGSEETPSERGVSRQSKKVSRSFSLAAPWKPRHLRDRYELEYDNKEVRDARDDRSARSRGDRVKSSLPPRPPKKSNDGKVGRSQTVYKDSKLAGWLRKRKNKEVSKGI